MVYKIPDFKLIFQDFKPMKLAMNIINLKALFNSYGEIQQ